MEHQLRELGIYVRFKKLTGHGNSIQFPSATVELHIIITVIEELFAAKVTGQSQPIRKVCVNCCNLPPLDFETDLFDFSRDGKRHTLQIAFDAIDTQFVPRQIKSGTRLLLERQAGHLSTNKVKYPFIQQREMEMEMNRISEPSLDPIYEDEWIPWESEAPTDLPSLRRTWGRSTRREQKFR